MAHKPEALEHIKKRISVLQKHLRDNVKADALLITNQRDVRYLTGFVGDDSWLIIKQRGSKMTLISDSRFEEQIKKEAPQVTAIIRKGAMVDELKAALDKQAVEKIALQPSHTTLYQSKILAKKLGDKRLVQADDNLINQRSIKQKDEIQRIKKAISIQQRAFKNTLEFLECGKSEQQIAAYLEFQMRSLGADGRSFPTIVAIDKNSALPHAIPGKKKLKKGSSILFDFGAKFDGYCSDLTRVVAFGSMKPKMREIYEIVLEAQKAATKAIKPGAMLKDIDKVARDIITNAGFGDCFGHSLGHGIGLDIHEQPTLSPRSDGKLKAGQVVTVEPGIYLPEIGGVRIEDDVLVVDDGYKILSHLPKSLQSVIIK